MSKTTAMLFSLGLGLLVGCGEGVATTGVPDDGLPTTTTVAAALPLGEYVFMGQPNVLMVSANVQNPLDTNIEFLSLEMRVTSGNSLGGAPNAFVDYQTSFGSAQNFKPSDVSGVYATSFSVGQNPITLRPGQEFMSTLRANTNTWDNLRLTDLHTRDQQINVQAEIIGFTYRKVGSSEIMHVPLAIKGKVYSLFRAIPRSIVSAPSVPNGYATNVLGPSVVTSAYTITSVGMRNQSIILSKGSIDWATAGLVYAGNGAKLLYTIRATDPWNPGSSLGDVVANGLSEVSDGSHGQIKGVPLSIPASGVTGLDVPTDSVSGRLLSVALGTGDVFAPGSELVKAVTTLLVGCEWGDGTREGLPCSPFVPVKGHIVAN